MLLSDKYGFLFVHIYKNAGTSIREALLPYTGMQFHYHLHRFISKTGLNWFNPFPYPKHIGARDLIREMGEEQFSKYFSFAFVRNPWDWQVSLYHYMLKDTDHYQHELIKKMSGFDEYIDWRCRHELPFQYKFIFSDEGTQLVDFIGRFEHLNEDFKTICTKIGIEATLPHLNQSNTVSYREYYTPKTRKMIADAYKKDIELFDYQF